MLIQESWKDIPLGSNWERQIKESLLTLLGTLSLRAHHGAERTITRETAAKLMVHSVCVHSNIYSVWLDSETMDAEVKRFNASLIERLIS